MLFYLVISGVVEFIYYLLKERRLERSISISGIPLSEEEGQAIEAYRQRRKEVVQRTLLLSTAMLIFLVVFSARGQ